MNADKTERFEDRLLAELKKEVALNAAEREAAAGPAPRRRLVTAPRVGFALAGGAAVAAGFIVLPGMAAPPAYAVEEKPDGSVQVSIKDLTLDRDEQRDLAADLRAAGVAVEIRNPEPGTRCASDLRVGSMTVLPGRSGGDGEFAVGRAYSPDSAVEAQEPRPPVGSRVPWAFAMDANDSMVIENFVPKEGAQHRTNFLVARGAPMACEEVPVER
ncbi:hypothetical protein [Streptomonospora wellingtoniae]|uniref:PASTA domain-containing protein n=1 Tax=Streptomonospora wellingtoniae TaxID=3075544 RepID=A0ABU2KSP3_9ACTN|nr:hypothetical protein [Streptomonospora sp. DSM 45055]MDT0302231.1 hypothetical protein [Streptomonospora sp. DSM 45055]